MPLTRDFTETVQARAERDPALREGLLKKGVERMLAGDVDTGKILLRDYINATIGFEVLGSLTDKPPKSLMRMFGPSGNPNARNLLEVISRILEHESVQLEVNTIHVKGMDTMDRYKIQESIADAISILDSAPMHHDLFQEKMIVELTNRMPIAHLAIERGLKALYAVVGGETARIHSLYKLYVDLREYDKGSKDSAVFLAEAADFLAEAFKDAVRFFGYNVNVKGFKHFRSLDVYLSRVGTENAFNALRYWAIGESPKGGNPIPYISPLIHRELLYALRCLFILSSRETVSGRVERIVADAMYMYRGRQISYGSDDAGKEQSVRWYMDWLFKEHTTRCSALEEAVTQGFVVTDDQFVVQTLRDAYEDLRQSMDPAVQYYFRTLTYLPEGSQRLSPDAVPEIEWRNFDKTRGLVVTPAGTFLGEVQKYADGGWGIIPSENGLMKVIETARALRDAKAYLVNRLTKQVTVTVNGESKQLRMVGNRDFFPRAAWTAETGTPIDEGDEGLTTYELELWDANHGLHLGEEVSMELQMELQSEAGHRIVSVLKGTITAVTEQKVSIKGTDVFTPRENVEALVNDSPAL